MCIVGRIERVTLLMVLFGSCIPMCAFLYMPILYHFLSRAFWENHIRAIFPHHHGLQNFVPKKFRKLPSAAHFFPKVFRRFDFWTFFLSIFWNFFDSCAKFFDKNNKINLCSKRVKMRAYMQRLIKGTTVVHFSAQKKLKKRHQMLKKTFYDPLLF